MSIQPIDEFKLIALMIAGAVFALTGLYLLLRRPAEADAARVEMFGLKFHASSTGLVVFLIGASLFAAPLFVPATPIREAVEGLPSQTVVPVDTPASVTEPAPGDAALPSDRLERVREAEPNNSRETAMTLSPGTYAGTVSAEDEDWFVFVPDDRFGSRFRVKLRSLKGMVGAEMKDQDGGTLGSDGVHDAGPEATYAAASVPIEYFLRIDSMQGGTNAYQFSLEYYD